MRLVEERHPAFSFGDWSMYRSACLYCLMSLLLALAGSIPDRTVESAEPSATDDVGEGEEAAQPANEVEIAPRADDAQIADRLQGILEASGWFLSPNVEVREGIVFLSGAAQVEEYKTWAAQLARRTEGVVAVVNRMDVQERPVWDLSPAWAGMRELARDAVAAVPFFIFGVILLVAAWIAARLTARWADVGLSRRVENRLLRTVAVRTLAILVFIFGLYLVLRVSGLTRLALTVVGGTGVIGIVVGIAFRDIAENFLASILISMQNPFRTGDLVEVEGHKGFVQRVTTRGTLLMALDGRYIQIPNAIIYKSTILNWTANPKSKQDFTVGIGYSDSIAEAQQTALAVIREHPAVLDDPEPLVLVEGLGASTVNLRIHFWMDSNALSILKVRSSVIRLVKIALQEAEISLPDEAREMIFPEGVPVRMVGDERPRAEEPAARIPAARPAFRRGAQESNVTTDAEGDLTSEAGEIQKQARESRKPEEGADLLGER
jgi:small conductance mechanosensitive channel